MSSSSTKARDPRLPFTQISEKFLPPRDPIVGYVKIGGKGQQIRFARNTGRPWVAPERYVDPPRFEVTTREKVIKEVKGQGKAKDETFKVDLGYKLDEEFHQRIGDKNPTSLRIRLMYPTPAENLIAFLGAHDGTRWVCRGDGEHALDVERGKVPCPCPRLKQFDGKYSGPAPKGNAPCKPHAQLNMILEDARTFGGFWAFKTTSFESYTNLLKSLQQFERLFGRLDGLPLELRVMAATKSYGEGMTTQPIVTLVVPESMNSARQIAADAAEESRKYLPLPSDQDREAYREAVIQELQEEEGSYVDEFMPGEDGPLAEAEPVDAPSEAGPDHEIVDEADEPADALEGTDEAEPDEAESGEGQSTRDPLPPSADSGAPDDSDRNGESVKSQIEQLEELCTAILQEAGYDEQATKDRIAYHRKKQGVEGLEYLRDQLKAHRPDAYAAAVEGGDLFEPPPDDGLPFE